MPADEVVIELLNEVLTAELTSTNQYFLDAKMLHNWGYERLADHFRSESISEMKDADELIERILFLEGLPNLQDLGKLLIGENVQECLECDLKQETSAHGELKAAIQDAETSGDYVSRELFKSILESEEEHIDFLETQLDLIGRIGLQNYTQSQIHEEDD